MNLALRNATPADDEWLASWLPAVSATVGHDASRLIDQVHSGRADGVRVIMRDGEDAGVIAYRPHQPARGSAIIELVALPAEASRRGSGTRAAATLEDELRRHGIRAIYAPAPEQHGIDVYFWIRLGYRPLPRAEWPCDMPGVGWFIRRLDAR